MNDNLTLPSTLDIEAAAALLEQQAPIKLIDVRTPAEFESQHIPGSYNVPLDILGKHRQELRDALREPAILVCERGERARQAERMLHAAGLHQVGVLEGGITAWERAGKELNLGRQRWGLERQVRGVAGALVLLGTLGGLSVWRPLALLAAFIGGGLTFSAVTNTCGMAMLLSKLPYNRSASCNEREVLARLAGQQV